MTICAGLDFNFLGQDLVLLPQKAIYWKQEKTLIAADVHMGKVGHFRKAGIAVTLWDFVSLLVGALSAQLPGYDRWPSLG